MKMENVTDNDKQFANVCLQFMQRADLKGGEVNQFSACCNWLLSIASGQISETKAADKLNKVIEENLKNIADNVASLGKSTNE